MTLLRSKVQWCTIFLHKPLIVSLTSYMYASTHCILKVIIGISYVIEKSDVHDDETIIHF